MASFKNFDPSQISIVFGPVIFTGFMDGTFVTVERDEDTFSKHAGADGDVTRVRMRNKMGKITVTLKAEAPANDLLSAIMKTDELTGGGVQPFMIKNQNGTTLCEAPECWITKPPNVEYGDEASGREWVFDCANLEMFVGGAVS